MAAACPDLEDLAAYLDGTLPVELRTQVTEHLATCETCYEVFAGAARFRLDFPEPDAQSAAETLDVPDSGQRRPFERRRQRFAPARAPRAWRRAVAAMAALLVAVIGLAIFRWFPGEELTSARLASEILAAPPPSRAAALAAVPWEGRRMRGPAETADVPLDRQSFRLGVRLLDVRLALAEGDTLHAQEALRHAGIVLGSIDFLPPDAGAAYQRMSQDLERGATPRSLLPAAATQEEKALSLGLVEKPFVDFGRWTEACRLNGLAGDVDFFRSRATRVLLRDALTPSSPMAGELDSQAADTLRTIRKTLAARSVAGGPSAARDLGHHCERLLEHFDSD